MRPHQLLSQEPVSGERVALAREALVALVAKSLAEDESYQDKDPWDDVVRREGVYSYEQSGEAAELLLRALPRPAVDVLDHEAARLLREFVPPRDFVREGQLDVARLEQCGWSPSRCSRISTLAEDYLGRTEWPGLAEALVGSRDARPVDEADLIADQFGRPRLPLLETRLLIEPLHIGAWHEIMAASDQATIGETLQFARETLGFDELAQLPRDELERRAESSRLGGVLYALVAGLERFPGRGVDALRIAAFVTSIAPALQATLRAWEGAENLPPEARRTVENIRKLCFSDAWARERIRSRAPRATE